MQWSSVVPNGNVFGRRECLNIHQYQFKINSERGFKIATACAFLDMILSLALLTVMLTSSPILLSPPPPKLVLFLEEIQLYFESNNTFNETIFFPSNVTDIPFERTFYCEKFGRKVIFAEFLGQVIYTGGCASVVFGALTKRTSFCYMHFPCSLIAIILGIGNRIIEVIYCKWFLMRWLLFVIRFAWYSLGDVVAKSLTVYMEDKKLDLEGTTQKKLIIPIA